MDAQKSVSDPVNVAFPRPWLDLKVSAQMYKHISLTSNQANVSVLRTVTLILLFFFFHFKQLFLCLSDFQTTL